MHIEVLTFLQNMAHPQTTSFFSDSIRDLGHHALANAAPNKLKKNLANDSYSSLYRGPNSRGMRQTEGSLLGGGGAGCYSQDGVPRVQGRQEGCGSRH